MQRCVAGETADVLARLAHDYDCWGLAPEAEEVRLQYRRMVVAELGRAANLPRSPRRARRRAKEA